MRSVDEAMDVVSTEPLCDWKGLKSNVHFPSYYRFLQMSRLPRRLVTYFTVERLESACYICAAFLRAHRIARQQLHDFIGDYISLAEIYRRNYVQYRHFSSFLSYVRTVHCTCSGMEAVKTIIYTVLSGFKFLNTFRSLF